MAHLTQKEFERINWLPIKERFNQCINSVVFKYFDEQCPHYLNQVFAKASESGTSLKSRYHKLKHSFPGTERLGLAHLSTTLRNTIWKKKWKSQVFNYHYYYNKCH